jgi:hypothetical protein
MEHKIPQAVENVVGRCLDDEPSVRDMSDVEQMGSPVALRVAERAVSALMPTQTSLARERAQRVVALELARLAKRAN